MSKTQQALRRYLALTLVILAVYLVDVRIFKGGPMEIIGMSMFPTITDHSRLYVFYTKDKIERNDIVTFWAHGIHLIKRVVAVPGDTIVLFDRFVYINGQEIEETFIYNNPTYKPMFAVLEKDEYFVMGDNRDCSWDSRSFGKVPRAYIDQVLGYYVRY